MSRTGRRGRRASVSALVVIVALVAVACTEERSSGAIDPSSTAATTTVEEAKVDRPDGPAVDVSTELTGGEGVFVAAGERNPPASGYVEHEFAASGTASSYRSVGTLGADGRWLLEPGDTADFTTRIVVRRPGEQNDFNGTVVVEWMNVSGGVDADPEYTTLKEEIERQGAIWVGVSAQVIGVEGGTVAVKVDVAGSEAAGKGLKVLDPARYGSLHHPGDAYSYDIFTQVARALRADGDVLGGARPAHLIAAGESQSAFAMVSYVNGVQPLTDAFDGFFVHSRGAPGLSIGGDNGPIDIQSALSAPGAIFRTDTDVPVLDIQTESDVVGIFGTASVRQPDTDTFRLWEVAGTAHADRHLMGASTADAIDCGAAINDGPMHLVAKAAFGQLVSWIVDGTPPAVAPRLQLTAATPPEIDRDADGIGIGGIRTPPVDVPTRVLSGAKGPSPDVICLLSGSTLSIPAQELTRRYGTRAEFQQRYDAAVDEAIAAGYLLDADRESMQSFAHPELVSS